ncbi:MAG: transcription elongation factor GreA [Thermodesulfobacteriota bacterium]
MSEGRIPITPNGYQKLKKELHRLKTVDRQEVIKAIEFARSLGDLSENAEYATAKDRQSFVEGRIQELEYKLGAAEIIDPDKLTNKNRVVFGVFVTLEDIDTGEIVKYQLIGPDETEPDNGRISITSPIGKALIGKEVDDEVQVRAPGGIREFIIMEIE